MKKILLFLSGALLSLGLSAAEYDVVINKANIDITADNNIDITDQLGGKFLKTGDVINLTVRGYFDAPATVAINCVADNAKGADGADGYWGQLSDWLAADLGKATIGEEFVAEQTIKITTDAYTKDKYVVQMAFLLGLMDKKKYGSQFKLRPTAAELTAQSTTYSVELSTVKFGADGGKSNYQADMEFETEKAMIEDDVLEVTINGKFNQDIDGIVFMIFDNSGNEVLGWKTAALTAAKDETVNTTIQLVIPASCTEKAKLSVFIEGYDAEKEIKFLKDGDVEHDAVELASKEYTDITLAKNVWSDGSNYQYVEEVASDVFAGDYFIFSINGVCDQEVVGLQAYLMNDSYSAISAYVPIQSNIAKDGSVEFSGKVEVSSASAVCKLVIVTTDAVSEGIDAINIKATGTTPTDPTAVEEVAASLSVQGGMVYSAGEIVVYNVAGKVIATASQVLNVGSLNAGVYFIVAQEGTIKYVK